MMEKVPLREFRKAISFVRNYVLSRPFYASFDVTNYCNLRCEGCNYPLLFEQEKLGEDLPLDRIEERLQALHKTFGSMIVVLAGFEPTIRKDLPEIIAAASQYNYVGIVSNGTLIDRDRADSYWKAGLFFAGISMPTFDERRFKELAQVARYGIEDAKRGIETMISTAPRFGKIGIAVTIDNKTTPDEIEQMAVYAKQVGAFLSFQPYSPSKPTSVLPTYVGGDERVITAETLDSVFNGSLSRTIIELKRKYPVFGRNGALKNFDVFVRKGTIPFKPRSLKIYGNGGVALHPEGELFSNFDRNPQDVWKAYRKYVEGLREHGPYRANNCYRCVNVTNPSTPVGDVFGRVWRNLSDALFRE